MALKNDGKFDEKRTYHFKNDMTNLVSFHSSTEMFQNLMGYFSPKCIIFELKKYARVMFHDTEE